MKEKSFKFREKYGKLVEKMTDKQAGEFIKAVSGYMFGGKPMESKDEYLKGVFLYVQSVFDTELRDRENGRLGGAIVAEKYKEMRSRFMTEEAMVSESNVVSQLIIVSSGEQSAAVDEKQQTDKPAPQKKRGRRPKTLNAYGGSESLNEKKGDRKTV